MKRLMFAAVLMSSLPAFAAELHDYVDKLIEQMLDVCRRKFRPSSTLLHEQHELLERKRGTGSVNARD